jgi:tyrosine-protein kinase Etk/Wzc
LLQQPAFNLLMSSLVQQYDHVVVDAPAFDAGADAQVVAERCGLVLALGRKGHTRMDALQSMLNQLRRVGVAIAGMVINTHQTSHASATSGGSA